MSHAITKQQRLDQVKRLLLMHPEGIHINDIQQAVDPDMDWSSIWRFVVKDLNAQKLEKGIYTLAPTQNDIDLAIAVLNRGHIESSLGINLDEAYQRYCAGETLNDLATAYNVSISFFHRWFQQLHLEMRPPGTVWTEVHVRAMREDYESGLSQRAVGEKWGISQEQVSDLFWKYGYPSLKGRGKQRDPGSRRGLKYNVNEVGE